jgi:ferredoxin
MTAGMGQPPRGADAGPAGSEAFIILEVDGIPTQVASQSTILEACDAAGVYVPRLCYHPGLGCASCGGSDASPCGLCTVRTSADTLVLACCTPATAGMQVITNDPEVRRERRERLGDLLLGHPHVCLSCPDRAGCARDECTHGNPPEARCCDQFGRCELGRVVGFVDPEGAVPRRATRVPRAAHLEGRIRREPGLCVGCGRCVRICAGSPVAGGALHLTLEPTERSLRWPVAHPKRATLSESGCTFCGQCVMVCPAGALTAPGPEGARWLAARRELQKPPRQPLPPKVRQDRLEMPADPRQIPVVAGVLIFYDVSDRVLRIAGVADLRQGFSGLLREPATAAASCFSFEREPLYTQRETELLAEYAREHGDLPVGNDLGDDLFPDGEPV